MKPRFFLRLAIKLAALVLYIMLLHDFGTGRAFHIAAGIAVCALTAAGIVLDRHNLRDMRRRYKNCTISTLDSILLSTETLVAVAVAAMLLTGILNHIKLPDVTFRMTVYGLHVAVAYLLLLTMAVRLVLQAVQCWQAIKSCEKQ